MPTYEYECKSCGYVFEKSQKMTDSSVARCPKCKSPARRLISGGVGVIVKGGSSASPGDAASRRSTACGKGTPCCGRDEPCEKRPCD
jgi:putative FmdB family regulatory protein